MKTFQNVYEALLGSPESHSRLALRMDIWKPIIFWLFAIHIALVAATPADLDMDLGWQIAQGRWMVQHHAIYRTDELNYPTAHQPVIDEYPLFQLLCYGANLVQPYGTTALRIVLCLALFLPLIYLERRLAPLAGDFLFPLSLVVAASLIEFTLRAQLISLLFTAIFVITLVKIGDDPAWRRAWPLFLLQVCWVNMHSGFILGPLVAVTIGFEFIGRQLLKGVVNRQTIYSWCLVWLALSFACLVNPYGTARLSLPFYQDNLNLIRIYVAEMHPLTGPSLIWGYTCVGTGLAIILIAGFSLGLRLPLGVIVMALIILHSALSTAKYWSFFVYFIPLTVLCARIMSCERKSDPQPPAPDAQSPFPSLGPLVMMAVIAWLGYSCIKGIPDVYQSWADFRGNRTLQPTEATAWIEEKHLKGNFMNRAEVGGWLQQHFFAASESNSSPEEENIMTYCDAGLGKYTPAFIQEIALLGDRPNLLPILLRQMHRSDLIVITSLQSCYWPAQLKELGYRLVFFSTNSSVWLPPDSPRTDLEEVSPSSVWARYHQDKEWLEKGDGLNFVRSLVTLHGSGCSHEAAAIWQAHAPDAHRTDDYWTVVRIICQDGGPTNSVWDSETAQLFYPEAEQQQNQPKPKQENSERVKFMALSKYYENRDQDALTLLHQALTAGVPESPMFSMLRLKILIRAGKWKDALGLAKSRDQFDPLSGEYWSLLARCLEHNQDDPAAAEAWQKALDLAPDVPGVLEEAAAFASRTHNDELLQSVRKWTGD